MYPYAAGCRLADIADSSGEPIPLIVFYPSRGTEQRERLGPYWLDLAMDAPEAAGPFPLVLLSHGGGGTPLVYRSLAQHLARNGFVVALPEHPGNNRNDNQLAGTVTLLENRPRQLRVAADWVFADDHLRAILRPGEFAIIGHSLGGYTALAVAGGQPSAFAHETPDQKSRKVNVVADDRVRALVLLAPATVWFMAPGALSEVRVPALMLTAEKDPHTPHWHGEIVKRGVADPSLVRHRTIPNAGHFSFLTPFPEDRRDPSFPPSQDPPGFDRERFQEEMQAEVLEFLRRAVGVARFSGQPE